MTYKSKSQIGQCLNQTDMANLTYLTNLTNN